MIDVVGRTVDRGEFLSQTRTDEISHNSLSVVPDPANPRRAVIRTSDRISFKNCRRRWGWSSHLRHNLGPRQAISPLWFGTGIHFALEDFHGWNRFGHPRLAFEEYVKVFKNKAPNKLPDDWEALLALGREMLDYYVVWLQVRKNHVMKTYWHEGEPQVEVNFRFNIPWEAGRYGWDEVVYSGTIDRVCIDEHGFLWPVDYKTAASIQTLHYLTDPQVSAYMWAAPHLYDKPIGGFIYQQHRKATPNEGRILQNGHVSSAQNQATSHVMYRETLLRVYKDLANCSDAQIALLNDLARRESEAHDDFIRQDKIHRNDHRGQAEGAKVLMEIEDMLNPDLLLYPNPVRECTSFCPFYSPCTSMDDGSDWEHELAMTTEPRQAEYDHWRKWLTWPGDKESDKVDNSWIDDIVGEEEE